MLVDKLGVCSPAARRITPKRTDGAICTIRPSDFLDTVRETIAEAVQLSGCRKRDIQGVSYASQTNTFVLLDKNRKPISDIYVWSTVFSDETDPVMSALFSSDDFLHITGNGYSSSALMVAKLKWLAINKPQLFDKCRYVANLPDFLILGLTGNLLCDASSASLLGLLDIGKLTWWDQTMDLLCMDSSMFPHVLSPGVGCGHTAGDNPFGLEAGIPVIAGGLDHLIAAYGAGIGYLAPYSESTGTVLALTGLKDTIKVDRNVTVGPALDSRYSHIAFHGYAAEAFEEFRELFCPDLTFDQMFLSSEDVPVGCDGLRFNDDPAFDDVFIRRFSRPVKHRGEGVRAIMEALAFRLKKLSALVAGDEVIHSVVATGGGNLSRQLLAVKADLLRCEIVLCPRTEFGAFGAAMVTAGAIGWFSTIREAQCAWIVESGRIEPDTERSRAYRSWAEKNERPYL